VVDFVTKYVPLLAGLMYAVVAVAYLMKKEYAWCLVWVSYAMANFGLMVAGN